MGEYGIIGFFVFLGTIFVGGGMVTSLIVSFRSPDTQKKHEPYECGEEAIGSARIQFKVGYYLFALLFLIFDVESLFLFPCAAIFRAATQGQIPGIQTWVLLVEIFVFVSILVFGLLYAWKKKVLEWE